MHRLYRVSTHLRPAARPASGISVRHMASKSSAGFNAHIQGELDAIVDAGTYKKERVITTAQEASIRVQESETPVLNFCANNYLGLSNHPEILQAAKDTIDTHGFGMSSVRFICGRLHVFIFSCSLVLARLFFVLFLFPCFACVYFCRLFLF